MLLLICNNIYNTKEVNIYMKQKQTNRPMKQTCGYKRREGMGEGQVRGMVLTDSARIYPVAQGIVPTVFYNQGSVLSCPVMFHSCDHMDCSPPGFSV